MSPRPARISRDDVLRAALALIDESGIEQLTMRRLGAALGADPMTAYRHFAGKSEIAEALVDDFWIGLPVPEPRAGESWQGYATRLMRAVRSALSTHPGLIPVVATHPISSPGALQAVDAAVGELLRAGAPVDAALGDLINVLVMITVSSALGEYSSPAGSDDDTAATPDSGDAASAGAELLAALPHLGSIVAQGWTPSAERQFEAAIAATLAGWRFSSGRTP